MTYTLIPGQPHTASEEETMSMIRAMLTEEAPINTARKAPTSRAVAPPATPVPRQDDMTQRAQNGTTSAPRSRATDFPELTPSEDVPASGKARRTGKLVTLKAPASLTRAASRLRNFRPSMRHLAVVSVMLLIVVRPHWFVIGAVLGLAAVAGAFVVLGADRVWAVVLAGLDRIEATDPARATILRTRLDRFAYRWDGFLDLFPEGLVDGLYMPDFQGMGQADDLHNDAMMQRLARMGHEG
jgi:hypothetical protein